MKREEEDVKSEEFRVMRRLRRRYELLRNVMIRCAQLKVRLRERWGDRRDYQ